MSIYKENRQKLFDDMKSGDMAVFFAGKAPASSADSLYPFRTDKNFYYMTGLKREEFILLMTKTEQKEQETLFILKPDYDMEKWVGRYLTVDQVKTLSGVDDVQFLSGFENHFGRLVYSCDFERLHMDLARVHGDRSGLAAHDFASKVSAEYPQLQIKDLHKFMRGYRVIKNNDEIKQIRKAIELTKVGLERVMSTLKPGDHEYVPAAEFAYSIMKRGADGNAFETIAASGGNATVLHYIENDDVMKDGDLILLDLGAQYEEYASDITRTYPINGKFTARQAEIYNLVLKARNEVVGIMKPGIHFSELQKTASKVLEEGLKDLGLVDEKRPLGKYYYHGVSHPLGLDTHDLGTRDSLLEPGMIFTVEPGLYIAEENIGIRIEDDVLITEEGNEVLSKDILRTVEEIEAFMATKRL